ncbi:hypothetical protein [Halovivax limisalsi]|uniref:hypothetical protein n=1 Tax=Halovivax limisalsi TaxID=1453760 RepID=UPI001FFD2675|nr:hypothetical protein [Halovivax limisalsi]
MATVDEWLTRDRRSERPALVDASGRTYDAHWLCTSAWKAGNFLRHTGARRGVTVGIDGRGPLAILSFLGTALLEARTWFEPPAGAVADGAIRTHVAPADALGDSDRPSTVQAVCYDGEPPAPDVHHLDAGLWSENPSFPPVDIDPATPLLAADGGDRSIAHAAAVRAAETVATGHEIDPGTRVGVATSFADPRAVVAGILAPLVSEGVTVLDGEASGSNVDAIVTDRDQSADSTDLPSSVRRIPIDAVELEPV